MWVYRWAFYLLSQRTCFMITPPIMGHSLHSFWSSFALWCRFDCRFDVGCCGNARSFRSSLFVSDIFHLVMFCENFRMNIDSKIFNFKKNWIPRIIYKGWERNKFPDYFSQSFRQIIFHIHLRFQSLYPGLSSSAQCTFMPPSLSQPIRFYCWAQAAHWTSRLLLLHRFSNPQPPAITEKV
jgi:hypothetical protein